MAHYQCKLRVHVRIDAKIVRSSACCAGRAPHNGGCHQRVADAPALGHDCNDVAGRVGIGLVVNVAAGDS